MRLTETLFLWLVVGLAIAAATWLRGEQRPAGQRLLHALFATLLWPLALPLLFTPRTPAPPQAEAPLTTDVAGRIAQVEARLAQALAKLPGLAGAALAPELARVRGVTTALLRLERRLAEMRAALAGPELDTTEAGRRLAELHERGVPAEDPRAQAIRVRLEAAARLSALAAAAESDRERVLCELEAIAARLTLVPFAARDPEAEALRELQKISAVVEEVTVAGLAA